MADADENPQPCLLRFSLALRRFAGLADDINGLTDPINDARGTEQ